MDNTNNLHMSNNLWSAVRRKAGYAGSYRWSRKPRKDIQLGDIFGRPHQVEL